jgi:hypothetical protein
MQTIDKHFRALSKAAFQTFGFAQGDILAHWPQIVGAELAAIATPERIRWPRGQSAKQGGTLHVKVQAGRALDVDYAGPGIVEKVNRFLGYAALARVKSSPHHEPQAPKPSRRSDVPTAPAIARRVKAVENPDLQAALARLGTGILADSATSPQAELRIGQTTPNSSRTRA